MTTAGPEKLLDLLAQQITASDIRLIAAHDRGTNEECQQHEAKLREILQGNYLINPRQDYWYPLEVIELTRWTDPEMSGIPMRSFWQTKTEAHRVRAFCCALMLRIKGEPGEVGETYVAGDETIIRLLESIRFLGEEFIKAGEEFFIWISTSFPDEGGRLCSLLTTLFMCLQSPTERDKAAIEKLAADTLKIIRPHKTSNIELELAATRDPEKWTALSRDIAALIEKEQPDMLSALYELQMHLQ